MQGVEHIPTMLRNIENGNLDPRAKPKIRQDRPAYALIDGLRGPGQVAALTAADNVISNAKKFGAAAAGIFNSADLYMLGYYTEHIARQNLLGIGISSGAPNTAIAKAKGQLNPYANRKNVNRGYWRPTGCILRRCVWPDDLTVSRIASARCQRAKPALD